MSQNNLESDLDQINDSCNEILTLINSRRTGSTVSTISRTLPEINLSQNDITEILTNLRNMGSDINSIVIRSRQKFSHHEVNTTSQTLVDNHAAALQTILSIQNGQMHQSDHGLIVNAMVGLQNSILDLRTVIITLSSYTPVSTTNSPPVQAGGISGKTIAAIATIILVVIGGGGYAIYQTQINVGPIVVDSPGTKIETVTSINQSGGITAGEVIINTGPQPRYLDELFIKELDKLLPSDKEKEIKIFSVLGDAESFQFASEIMNHLESEGWKVDGINQAVFSKPITGVQVTHESDGGATIRVGSNI